MLDLFRSLKRQNTVTMKNTKARKRLLQSTKKNLSENKPGFIPGTIFTFHSFDSRYPGRIGVDPSVIRTPDGSEGEEKRTPACQGQRSILVVLLRGFHSL